MLNLSRSPLPEFFIPFSLPFASELQETKAPSKEIPFLSLDYQVHDWLVWSVPDLSQ